MMVPAKYYIFLFGLFFMGFSFASAQTVEWGNQQKHKSKTSYTIVLGENSSGVFLLRGKSPEFKKDLVLEKYKGNLAFELTKDLPAVANKEYEKFLVQESQLIAFATTINQGKVEVLAELYDNFLNLASTKVLYSVDAALFKDRPRLIVRQSVNAKWLSVCFLSGAAEKLKSQIHLLKIDASLNVTDQHVSQLNNSPQNVYITNAESDNAGNLFVLFDTPGEEKKARQFYVKAWLKNGFKDYRISNDTNYINEIGFVVNNLTNSLAIVGFYSNKPDNICVGQFFYKIGINANQTDTVAYKPFEDAFINRFIPDGNNHVVKDLYIRKIVPTSDGGCTVLAEHFYETKQAYTYTINGFAQTNYRTISNYDELVVICNHGDGSTKFKHVIKKTQSSIGDGGYYSSVIPILTNDKIGIIYNADVVGEGDILMATINNKGAIESNTLIKAVSYFVTVMPPESKQVGANSAIITTLKDRRFCLMRLSF